MKFICLAYEEEKYLASLTKDAWSLLRDETLQYVGELQKNGALIAAEPLQTVKTARTVRMRERGVSVTDGPFAETKEQLGGFFILEAKNIDEATRLASKWPSARFGSIEVRPLETELRENGRYG